MIADQLLAGYSNIDAVAETIELKVAIHFNLLEFGGRLVVLCSMRLIVFLVALHLVPPLNCNRLCRKTANLSPGVIPFKCYQTCHQDNVNERAGGRTVIKLKRVNGPTVVL